MSKITLYEGIKTSLTGLSYTKADNTTDSVQHVALWRNNLEREKVEIPFNFPAVFIEFLTSNYMEGSSKAHQSVNMTVRLHICFKSSKTEDLDILLLTQQIYSTLQLKQYGFWGVLKRRNEEQNFDHDNVQDFMQDYDAGQCKDYGADVRPSTPATITDIDLTVVIDPELE
jgi:hypothetical protein